MSKKRRVRNLEARVAELERIAHYRDWDALPQPYDIPMAEIPTDIDMPVPAYELDDEGWSSFGYI